MDIEGRLRAVRAALNTPDLTVSQAAMLRDRLDSVARDLAHGNCPTTDRAALRDLCAYIGAESDLAYHHVLRHERCVPRAAHNP